MKKQIAVLLSAGLAVVAPAEVIQFDLSPPGASAAVGLSPLNEVPPATNSTASGNEISAGISFDTDTSLLTLAVGFGAAAGFADLSAPITALHIHGPALPGSNAPVVVNLASNLFLSPGSGVSGVVYGTVPIPTNEVANLLAGLHYLNIHSTNYPGGELRGQLIPQLNQPPVLVCPEPATVECGGATTVTAKVSDPEGDALVIVWSVNGTAIQTNELAAGATTTTTDVNFVAEFPLGTNSVAVSVTDAAGATEACTTTVTVQDTVPPVISQVAVTPKVLWPPNHKMVPVKVTAVVADVCSTPTWKITSITSNEAVDAKGSGNTAPDWQITGPATANLRAERSGVTGPRIYTLTIVATDAAGNESQPKTVTVTVPHDLRTLILLSK
jgi:hypothetical protein